jgi:tetratricopeptide (TPR) repeat protein
MLPGAPEQVATLSSTARYHSRREALAARYEALGESGYDLLLENELQYGVFGPRAMVVAEVSARLLELPNGRERFDDTVRATSGPVLASHPLGDVTQRLFPNLSDPRLTTDSAYTDAWTNARRGTLRLAFEEVIAGSVSALLCELGLVDEAPGHYFLGLEAMNRKDFDGARAHLQRAAALGGETAKVLNARAVNAGHAGRVEDAIALADRATAADPDFGPAWYNLAWWYATEANEPARAADAYERARALGMPEAGPVEKALEAATEPAAPEA